MTIRKSWDRCRELGLDEHVSPDFAPLDGGRLSDALDANRNLAVHALPVMETLYEQIVNTESMVILTDARGLVLHSLGDDDFLQRADKIALRPGVSWSEETKGTNAIGTAIFEEEPVLVHGPQHFLSANHFLTCSASPIFDPRGSVAGVLDVTGDQRGYHQHTMALVRMSARMIENTLFARAYPDALTLRFHTRPEFIGTLVEGLAVFSQDGRFLAANRSALFQLGLDRAGLRHRTADALFGMPMARLLAAASKGELTQVLKLVLHTGVTVYARPEAGPGLRAGMRIFVESSAHATGTPTVSAARLADASPMRDITLSALDIGDARIQQMIARITRVVGRDISVLIQGETGTGKELFARAIHNMSPRCNGPFVAVNCASIPDGLIESELFGYEEGAFTGAKRRGTLGKIQLANGGTLFLDEIGDMPVNLQARLLRVLQERVVMPLGSIKAQPVDVAIICATNCRLKERIRAGQFREDLYYRLNGLLLTLPPLRERTDLRPLVRHVLDTQIAGGARYAVSEDVMALFERHPWPGNCRQLANLLRTATVMAGESATIEGEHLPEDFFEDLDAGRALDDPGVAPAAAPREPDTPARLRQIELEAIRECVARCGGNISVAARTLGIARNTLYRKLRQSG
ncbi:MAG: sigma-54-dependent Fis family transcriptional regulator [Betaproteobacteria bacterium]